MTCYHPLIRTYSLNQKKIKAQDGHMYYKAQIYRSHDAIGGLEEDLKKSIGIETQKIPCGKCIGCRLDYSREWANRGFLEAKCWKDNYFVTLTYDDMNLPTQEWLDTDDEGNYTRSIRHPLIPEDFTKFMKKLRKELGNGIRFMGCGEYGTEGKRPHFHIILFNAKLPKESFYKPRIINNEMYFQNTIIEKCWKKGLSNVSEASWNNIAYTARYITKKINGDMETEHYDEYGNVKEFFRTSRNGGIGKFYYDAHKNEIYKNDEIIVKNRQGAVSYKPPKYFDDMYEKEQPKKMKEIKRRRLRQAEKNQKAQDDHNSYTRLEQLNVDEYYKAQQSKQLIRSYEKEL